VELPVRPCVQAISALQGVCRWVGECSSEAERKDEATMLYQSDGQFAQ
jgi:hypothetical protein